MPKVASATKLEEACRYNALRQLAARHPEEYRKLLEIQRVRPSLVVLEQAATEDNPS